MKKTIFIALLALVLPLSSHAADLIADGTYSLNSDGPDSFVVPLSGSHESSTTLDFAPTTDDPIFQKIAGDFTLYDGTMPFADIRVTGGVPHLLTLAEATKPVGQATFGLPIMSDRDLGPLMLSVTFGGDDIGYQRYYYVLDFVRTAMSTNPIPVQQSASIVAVSAAPVPQIVPGKELDLAQVIALIKLLISLGIVKLQ